MLKQVEMNCHKFYKMKLGIKNAFDYAKFNPMITEKEKEEKKYILDTPEKLFENKTTDLKEMLFFFRNNNKMMLTLINNLPEESFESLASLFGHFFYENILNSTLTQEDMLLLIYLLLEQIIDKKVTNTSNPSIFLNDTFVLTLIKSLNRKEDIRQYLIIILSQFVLEMETITEDVLNLQINNIINQLKEKEKTKTQNENKNKNKPLKKIQCKGDDFVPMHIKLEEGRQSKLEHKRRLSQGIIDIHKLNFFSLIENEMTKDNEDNKEEHEDNKEENTDNKNNNENELPQPQIVNDINNDNKDEIFKQTEINLETLHNLINNSDKSNTPSNEMKEYLQKQISYIKQHENAFSQNEIIHNESSSTISSLNIEGTEQQQIQPLNFSNKTIINDLSKHDSIIKETFISNIEKLLNVLDILLQKLTDNLNTLPYSVKCIAKIVDTLITQKFEKDKSVSPLDKAMYTITTIFESFIIPIIASPDFNGLITTKGISESTKTNLQIIVKILKQLLKGTLFNTSPNEYTFTVFNSYIIKLMSKVLRLVNFVRNTKLPVVIDNVNSKRKERTNDKENRDIDYSYFVYNHKENITHQSVCVNLRDVFTFITIIKEHKNKFYEAIDSIAQSKKDVKEKEQVLHMKTILDNVVCYDNFINNLINEEENVNKVQQVQEANEEQQLEKDKIYIRFIFFSKVIYRDEFKDILDGKFVANATGNAFSFTSNLGSSGLGGSIITGGNTTVIATGGENNSVTEKIKMLNKKKDIVQQQQNTEVPIKRVPTLKEENKDNKDNEKDSLKKKEDNKMKMKLDKIKSCLCKVLLQLNYITKSSFEETEQSNDSFDKCIIPKLREMLKEHYAFDVSDCYKGPSIPDARTSNTSKNINSTQLPYQFYFSYFAHNLKTLPKIYSDNNYALLLNELIKETEQKIQNAKYDAVNQIYLKVKGSDKLNMIINSSLSQLKQMEQTIASEKFVKDVEVKINMKIIYENGDTVICEPNNINNIDYDNIKELKITACQNSKDEAEQEKSTCTKISDFIKNFPDFSKIKKDDIIDYLESKKIAESINQYFVIVKDALKALPYFQNYTPDEFVFILTDLENYIQCQIYNKLFPVKRTKKDIKIHNKCKRLNWLSPSHLIKDQKVVNKKLWKTAIEHINEMDKQTCPANKIKSFGKAFAILQNSITFCTGKDELGVDDSIQVLLYVLLTAQPKRIWSNFNYSRLFIDPELSKKQFGLLLTQMEMVIAIIENMKYTDLIGVTEEQFGVDDNYDDIDVDNDNV